MTKKETVSKDNLFCILDLIEATGIRYWLDGGWGVDVLYGKQTRPHRDVDIDFDAQSTEKLLQLLKEKGFEMVLDCSPVRMELYHPQLGYIDIHPFILFENGTAKQANPEGGYWEFEAAIFGKATFEWREIPCISAKGQRIFHSGYELRDVDIHDINMINQLCGRI